MQAQINDFAANAHPTPVKTEKSFKLQESTAKKEITATEVRDLDKPVTTAELPS